MHSADRISVAFGLSFAVAVVLSISCLRADSRPPDLPDKRPFRMGFTPWPADLTAEGVQIAEEFVYDANFIKLRELRIAYRIPDRWLLRTPLRSLTVALVGRNLAYLYNTVPNVDPESSYNNGNAQGLELAGVPQTRSLGLSINARF